MTESALVMMQTGTAGMERKGVSEAPLRLDGAGVERERVSANDTRRGVWYNLPRLELGRIGNRLRLGHHDHSARRREEDPNRIALDDAIGDAFEIPDLSGLRRLLSKEPIISGMPLY